MIKITGYLDDKIMEKLERWNTLVDKIGKTTEERADQDSLTFELASVFNGSVKASILWDKTETKSPEVHDGKE